MAYKALPSLFVKHRNRMRKKDYFSKAPPPPTTKPELKMRRSATITIFVREKRKIVHNKTIHFSEYKNTIMHIIYENIKYILYSALSNYCFYRL